MAKKKTTSQLLAKRAGLQSAVSELGETRKEIEDSLVRKIGGPHEGSDRGSVVVQVDFSELDRNGNKWFLISANMRPDGDHNRGIIAVRLAHVDGLIAALEELKG
jgi:hypothetical protein